MRPEKLLDFFDSISAFERDDEQWLTGVARAARDVWGRDASTFSTFYDASDPRDFRVKVVVSEGISKDLGATFFQSLKLMTPDLIERVFRRSLAGSLLRVAPELAPVLAASRHLGVGDSFGFCGSEPSGLGCSITLHMAASPEIGDDELQLYQRMALHLGAAFRCRDRLREESRGCARVDRTAGAEAILDSSGKVVHAEGPAKTSAARQALADARRGFERARTKTADPIAATNEYPPLVDARWILMESHDTDGARYIVARENQAAVKGLERLTDRERQVVALLALGRTSKEIAYALGISDSTARVLLARAMTRLGVRTRDQLVAIVTSRALPGLA